MDTDILKTIFDGRNDLLTLPQTLTEVLRVARDDRSSADDLAGVLMRDPSLTARVLRIVNSPFYGAGRQVGSVKQAVMMLGVRQITALALSTSIYKMTDRWDSSWDRIRFWRHSLEVAIAARMIAERIGSPSAEEAFVAGLLHDIGLLILENVFPDVFARIWRQAAGQGDRTELEEQAWGTNHARVGQFLLNQWRLPESICQSVGHHHNVFVSGGREPELIPCQIICLANHISHFPLGIPAVEEITVAQEQREILRENLRLSRDALSEIQRDLFGQTVAEAQYLEVDIGSADGLLMEANRLLFQQYVTAEKLVQENRQMQQQILRDQVRWLSQQSLKSATTTFARYVDDAVTGIRQKAEGVKAGIESGAIHDPTGLVVKSTDAILSGGAAVHHIMDEWRSLADLDKGAGSDEAYLVAVEKRIRQQLESIVESTPS